MPSDQTGSGVSGSEFEERHVLHSLRLTVGQAMFLFAGLVGLTSGAAAYVFYWLINVFVRVFLLARPRSLSVWDVVVIVLSPAVGGLICGLLLHCFAPDARGGVTEVIDALLHRDGYIRARVGFFKAIASAVCIGSGGSAGREGPVVQIGASVGSSLARLFRVTRRRAQLLVACGAAGGIAAVFNAPIAGAFFTAEIITGRFEMRDLSYLFTASAMGAIVARSLLQNHASFAVPAYQLSSSWALFVHAVLGVLCALVGHLFVQALHLSEHVFERLRLHPVLKPALGGLLVGLMGLRIPQVFGTGSESLSLVLRHPVGASLLLLWLAGKLVSTSLTLGSGGSGGDLMPSLFLGAMLGGIVGDVVHHLLPAATMPPGGYALVGAGALFAGVAHAPITGIILGFEMGRDYGVVLPLMVSCSVSALVASQLHTASLYTFKLHQRGVDIQRLRGTRRDLLDSVRVGEVMTRDVPVVPPDLPLAELLNRFSTTGHHGFVVAEGDRLLGIVTLSDAQTALDGTEALNRVRDIATEEPIVCYPSDTLNEALRRLGTRQVGRIPVVLESAPDRVVGILRRGDILQGYSLALARDRGAGETPPPTPSLSAAEVQGWDGDSGGQLLEFQVHERSWFRQRRVRDLGVPSGCVLVAVRRGHRTMAVSGSTVLRAGDHVSAFMSADALESFERWLQEPPKASSEAKI
jgi:CIC family chloride channel protein